MIGENQFAVYQMKQTLETRQIRFRPYQTLQEKGIRIRQEDYEQVYMGTLYPQDTPESVRERLDRQPPRSFAGHSISVSDVLMFSRSGTVTSYYVEKTGFTVIENFIKNESSSSGTIVSIDTTNFQIEGKAGSWLAFDSIRLEGQEFFLMEHETYGKEAAWVVVDGAGKLAVDNVRNGFDREVRQKLEQNIYPQKPGPGEAVWEIPVRVEPVSETDIQEKILLRSAGNKKAYPEHGTAGHKQPEPYQEATVADKERPADWQRFMKNEEYLRRAEISAEHNHDVSDRRKYNMPPKSKRKGKISVLAKLHKKQAEIAKRNGKKEHLAAAENDVERKEK